MRAKDQIHIREALLQTVNNMLLLHHAAAKSNHHPAPSLLVMLESAYIAKNTILSVLTHSTGIIDHKVSIRSRFAEAISHTRKHSLYFFSVAHVLLTAEAVDVCQRHLLTLCVYRFYFFYIFLLNKQFFLVYLFSQAVSPFLIQSPVAKTVYHNRL